MKIFNSRYRYFVAYSFNGKMGQGDGSCEITIDEKIKLWNDIKEIQNKIKSEHGFDQVVVMNFILLGRGK